jgi:alpha-L-fucosidase
MRLAKTLVVLSIVTIAFSLPQASHGAEEASAQQETQAQRDARMQWWRDARFGMFIHWGLYAVPAGTWEGKQIGGIGEWIMDRANIPVEKYEKLATQFNPVKFDAAEWVQIAKDAGMKYIVITSKHHDGFCLFDTDATDWDVVDRTPYKKDLLIQLSKECDKQGLKFCTYYSIMDWHHPAQYRGSEKRYNPTKIHNERKAEYMAFMKQQLKELLDTCDPEVLWFDGEWPAWYTEEDGREIYAYLRKLKPQIIINNRVGKGRKGMEGLSKGDREYVGDFGTPEQQIPATGLPGVDWESCMTMNRTWGYKSYDHDWKSSETLIRNLIDIASKGGNYLLNVGPTAEGLIPGPSVERLAAIGVWMKANGESIYATQASPFAKTPWGRCTKKKLDRGNTRLYLHIFNWPQDGKLVVPDLANAPIRAALLDGGKSLDVTSKDKTVTIALPAEMPDKIATVVVLDVEGKL